MPIQSPQDPSHHTKDGWQDYQKHLKRADTKRKFLAATPRYACPVLLILIVAYMLTGGSANTDNTVAASLGSPSEPDPVILPYGTPPDPVPPDSSLAGKPDIRSLVPEDAFLNLRHKAFDIQADGQILRVETSIDLSLQHVLLDAIDTRNAEDVGIVAMEPSTGRILAMASFDSSGPLSNQCVDSLFPAASVFKIVTAAAGIEILDYDVDSSLTYNGRKHTLYRSQLKARFNRYTHSITLQDSFAQSINPVFGKMGASLGKTVLERYADAFGFNHTIDFELPVVPSIISLSDDPYQWAEIASGFNRETSMSPLHGALMAAVILNGGRTIEPAIVSHITNTAGRAVYRHRATLGERTISPEAALILSNLMVATVRSGTCRRTFEGHRESQILSQLRIGGKTGSINSRSQDKRYDWFVGFAREKDGSGGLVLSVLVAHGRYIGTRASSYARLAIEHFFGNYFAKTDPISDRV